MNQTTKRSSVSNPSKKATPSHVKFKRWLILPDLHIPYHDERAVTAIEQLMLDYRFDGWLQLGDMMDFDCISSHNKNNLRAVEGKRIQKDYAVAAKFLDRQQALIRAKNPDAQFVIIEGNHSNRVDRYVDANPALEGMVEVPTCLEFGRRKIKWVPYWSKGTVFTIGKAAFIHGRYTNDAHAKKHVQRYGKNVFYGHLHDVQSYSAEMLGEGNTLSGQSLGCLCLPQKYMQGAPDKWQHAFAIIDFFPDGNFTPHVIKIFKHRFTFGDKKVYEG